MALFRLRHAQDKSFPFLVLLPSREIAIYFGRFDFSAPIPLDYFDRFFSIRSTAAQDRSFRLTRWIFAFHHSQSAGVTAALISGSALNLNWCAVITSATEPMIRAAATTVRMVKVSPAKAVPSRTATIGFT
jgi:hypothetical protein